LKKVGGALGGALAIGLAAVGLSLDDFGGDWSTMHLRDVALGLGSAAWDTFKEAVGSGAKLALDSFTEEFTK